MGAPHTPGPWYYQPDSAGAGYDRIREEASDYIIATAEDGGHVDPQFAFPAETIEANARLITAAPELYDALAQARQALATYQPDSAPTFYMEALWAAEVALAKARGE